MYKELVRKVLKKEKAKGKINIMLTDDRTVHALNKKYRHKDKPTDVLSFTMGEDGILGDIAISEDTTRRNAGRYGVPYRAELKRLVVHGVLHILGYEHGKKMRDAEEIYQKL